MLQPRPPLKEPTGRAPALFSAYIFRPWPWPGCVAPGSLSSGTDLQPLDIKRWRVHISCHLEFPRASIIESTAPTAGASAHLVPDVGRLERMAANSSWRFYAACVVLRKPASGGQPKDPSERKWRLDCGPGALCRPKESPSTTLSVNCATAFCPGKKRQASSMHANPTSPAAVPTSGDARPRRTVVQMGDSGLSRARFFSRIPGQSLEAYLNLHIYVLRRCASLARARGANATSTTEALHNREILTLAFALRLYQGEVGKGSEALETAALRELIPHAQASGDSIVQLRDEAVDAAQAEKDGQKRHPAALSKKLLQQASAKKRVERARDLARAAQYRRSIRTRMHSNPAHLDGVAPLIRRGIQLRVSPHILSPTPQPIAEAP